MALILLIALILPHRVKKRLAVELADRQFPCGRVKRFLKNNTQNKMRVGAKGTSSLSRIKSALMNSRRLCNCRPRVSDRRSP